MSNDEFEKKKPKLNRTNLQNSDLGHETKIILWKSSTRKSRRKISNHHLK
jgi:hypothetical protein